MKNLRVLLLLLVLLVVCAAGVHAADDDDERSYSMAAVEALERAQEQQMQRERQHVASQTHDDAMLEQGSDTLPPQDTADLNEREEQRRFFSEADVDAFLQQHEAARAVQNAKAATLAAAKAQAEAAHLASMRALAAQRHRNVDALSAAETSSPRLGSRLHSYDRLEGRSDTEDDAESLAAALLEEAAEAEVQAQAQARADAEAEVQAEAEAEATRDALQRAADVEAAGLLALRQAETVAKLKAKFSPVDAERRFLAHAHSQSGRDRPWWTTSEGRRANVDLYARGQRNALLPSTGANEVRNAANSYALPLLRRQGKGRMGAAKHKRTDTVSAVEDKSLLSSASSASQANLDPSIFPPPPFPSAPLVPAAPVPLHLSAYGLLRPHPHPKQPFPGAGFYGSDGVLHFPSHALADHRASAVLYAPEHAAAFQRSHHPYPFFPSSTSPSSGWSARGGRESDRVAALYSHSAPLYLADAQDSRAARRAFEQSQQRLARLRAIPTFVVAPVVGPRRVVGVPSPTAPQFWAAPIPSSFPQPRDSNSFAEQQPYAAVQQVVVPAGWVPHGTNPLLDPRREPQPQFGGYPLYVPT